MIATVGGLGGIANIRAELLLQLQRTVCNLVSSLAFATVLETEYQWEELSSRDGSPAELGKTIELKFTFTLTHTMPL